MQIRGPFLWVRRDSNPQAPHGAGDFKSPVSAIPPLTQTHVRIMPGYMRVRNRACSRLVGFVCRGSVWLFHHFNHLPDLFGSQAIDQPAK